MLRGCNLFFEDVPHEVWTYSSFFPAWSKVKGEFLFGLELGLGSVHSTLPPPKKKTSHIIA